MPAKEILHALQELVSVGWRVQLTSGRARAYCPGGEAGCPPLTVYGTPKVPEHEAEKISRAMRRCPTVGEGTCDTRSWYECEEVGRVHLLVRSAGGRAGDRGPG